MKAIFRASRIGRIILRYRLDDLLQGTPAERWLRLAKPFVPRASADIAAQSRGARLRLALQDLGPIFVKFGQILSTRRDLIPADVANELTLRRRSSNVRSAARSAKRSPASICSRWPRPRSRRCTRPRWPMDARWWSRCCARTLKSRSTRTSRC